MSQFKDMDAALAERAAEFDKDLQMGPALPEVETELWAALTSGLPVAPQAWLTGQITALMANPTQVADLVRRLLAERMRTVGQVAADEAIDVPEWPFDPATGTPVEELPIKNRKLLDALSAACRGQRVHPQCARPEGAVRCTCPEHPVACPGRKAQLPHWRQRATTKPNQLFAWWAKWPDSEVGLAGGTGRGPGRELDQRKRAVELLADMLGDGDAPSTAVYGEAADRGISKGTLRRAIKEMGVKSDNVAGGGKSWWVMYWPEKAQQKFINRDTAPLDVVQRFLIGQQG
jgi:hypothetical protein